MEQQTDVRTLVDRGETLLRDEKAAEAAAEFARAAQLDPNAVGGHLGLAEANLALGQFGIAQQAANYVRQLAPGTADAALAEAILAVIAHSYDAALDAIEREIDLDPTRAYAHALRAYILRRLSRNYDAALAEARAARLSGKRDWSALFPQTVSYGLPAPIPAPPPTGNVVPAPGRVPPPDTYAGTPHRIGYAQQRQWQGQWGGRRMVRLRLLFATQPIVTYTLIAVNVAIWAVLQVLPFIGLGHVSDAIYSWGIQDDAAILHDPLQAYRFLTAMFLHRAGHDLPHRPEHALALLRRRHYGASLRRGALHADLLPRGACRRVDAVRGGCAHKQSWRRAGRVWGDLRHLRRVRRVPSAAPTSN